MEENATEENESSCTARKWKVNYCNKIATNTCSTLPIQWAIVKMSILNMLPHFKFKNFQWEFQRSSWNHAQDSQPVSEQKSPCLAITVQRFVLGKTGVSLAFTEGEMQLFCSACQLQMEEEFLPINKGNFFLSMYSYNLLHSSDKWVYFPWLQVQTGEKMTDNVTPIPQWPCWLLTGNTNTNRVQKYSRLHKIQEALWVTTNWHK